MAEVIDYNVLFWLAVAVVSFSLGSLYDKLEQQRATSQKSNRQRQQSQEAGGWSAQTGNSYDNYNSNRYDSHNNSNNNNNSTWTQQQHQSGQFASSNFSHQDQREYAPNKGELPTSSYDSNRAELEFQSRHQASLGTEQTIPTATGFNSDCVEWVNSILYAFYTLSDKYGPVISESINRSLNEKVANITSSSPELRHLSIEFANINRTGQKRTGERPELTNLRTENESEKSVSAICKIYNRRLSVDLTVRPLTSQFSQFGSAAGGALHYELTFENLEGKLKSVAMLNDKLIVIQFMEKPDTKILLRPKHEHLSFDSPTAANNATLISEDALVSVILQTLTQVVVDLYFGDDPDFPQYTKRAGQHSSGYRNKLNLLRDGASEIKRQFKHDFFGALTSSNQTDKERKVFVKIIKANNINYNQNVTCLLELDAPNQQALSSTKQGSNPYWEEHFLFVISDKSNELVFELWDSIGGALITGDESAKRAAHKSTGSQQQVNNRKWSRVELEAAGKFLGLARVSVDSLRKSPVQKVALMLEARPALGATSNRQSIDTTGRSIAMPSDLSNSVGGELHLELMFLEHSTAPPASGGHQQSLHKSGSMSSLAYQQGDIVSVDRKLTPTGYVITTTTITKPAGSKQRRSISDNKSRQQQQQRYDQLSVRNQSPVSSATDQSELDIDFDGISSQVCDNQSGYNEQGAALAQQQQRGQQGDETSARSRSRSRSRSLLRAIKKRFSFSRTRSRSVGETSNRLRTESRSIAPSERTNLDKSSIESRSRASSEASIGRAKSVPASRDPSEVPMIVINKSRLSDTASAFTFAHPKSQLVIECDEAQLSADGSNKPVKRYYAISDEQANKSKWRKRGVKLHLFNEHQFIACHLAGSSTCHLCGRVFSRRPGKQGYKCRNCHLLSHKQCHVKVDHNCPYAAREGLKLEFIDADPPESLLRESGRSDRGNSLPREQTPNRPVRLQSGLKSISMDVDDR